MTDFLTKGYIFQVIIVVAVLAMALLQLNNGGQIDEFVKNIVSIIVGFYFGAQHVQALYKEQPK